MRGLAQYSKEVFFSSNAPGPALWVGVDKIENALDSIIDRNRRPDEWKNALNKYKDFLEEYLGKGAAGPRKDDDAKIDFQNEAKQRLVPVGEQMAENILKSGHL